MEAMGERRIEGRPWFCGQAPFGGPPRFLGAAESAWEQKDPILANIYITCFGLPLIGGLDWWLAVAQIQIQTTNSTTNQGLPES